MKKPFQIQAKLDLHGYTLNDAYDTFFEFVEYCLEQDVYNLLIVTGKGSNSKERGETINYQFPHWCENPFLGKYIKSVKPAEIQHGGGGAFYVRLK
ncbi:MAG TPA: hypothetical protein DIV86_03270 [Alphaproteobacteria bacterium]|nr:hypothetical protein [Alphaproteobacteria bacterium]